MTLKKKAYLLSFSWCLIVAGLAQVVESLHG